MNRFRTRKKSHDGGDVSRRPSADSEVPPLPTTASRSRTFRRGKKAAPEQKPQVDIATVLPSSEDFRTSLLMPNLSARFSMLREQDDPTSKLGKANDDSVLFPKRASRLNIFSTAGLTDISEDSSIRSPIRPPFASSRTGSYRSTDGYGTEDDSSSTGIMGRSRPGESNTFFGGRQKIYKIPVGGSTSSKDVSSGEAGLRDSGRAMQGRAVYNDDVALSAFQIQREKDRQEREERERQSLEHPSTRSSKDHDRPESPSFATRDRNRETSSSTTSGPPNTRVSTAATSVASQSASSVNGSFGTVNGSSHSTPASKQATHGPSSLERSVTKSKRLYGQGLDQHVQDQQSSSMHRLNSIERQRTLANTSAKSFSQSRSATNLHERFQRSGPIFTSNSFRAGSPPPATSPSLSRFELGLQDEQSTAQNEADTGFGRSPSLSPPMSPGPDNSAFIASLEPKDLGKATASGAFRKPVMQFDEKQYAERIIQLQRDRKVSLPTHPSQQHQTASNKAESLIPSSASSNIQNPGKDRILGAVLEVSTSNSTAHLYHDNPATSETFYSGLSSSDSDPEMDPSSETLNPTVYQSLAQIAEETSRTPPQFNRNFTAHPHEDMDRPFIDLSEEPSLNHFGQANATVGESNGNSKDIAPDTMYPDSPTLNPIIGLSNLIRAHMRNDSGQSSIYPDTSPDVNTRLSTDTRKIDINNDNDTAPRSTWDRDNWRNEIPTSTDRRQDDRTEPAPQQLSTRARQVLDQAAALRNFESSKAQQIRGADKAQQVLGGEAPRRSHESTWTSSTKSQHTRDASLETQKEREELATELAERRKRVQDNLKSFVETENASANSSLGSRSHESNLVRPGGAFGILKSKTSRSSLVGKPENSSKAMKMLGMGSGGVNGGHPSYSPQETNFREAEEQPSQQRSHGPPDYQPVGTPSHHARSPHGQRFQNPRDFRPPQGDINTKRKPSPPSLKSTERDRSNPNTFAPRQYDRNGYQVQPPRAEMGPKDLPHGYNPTIPHSRVDGAQARTPPESTRGIAPTERSESVQSGRARSNSRNTAPAYFDYKNLAPLRTQTQSPVGLSPRPSPAVPNSAHSTPTLYDNSPAISTASTPTMITSQSVPTSARLPSHRKRSINKHDISEPTFQFSTSSFNTVDLPTGASLSNGMPPPPQGPIPPIPPLNPRRQRTTTTQNIFTAFAKNDKIETIPLPTARSQPAGEELSTFSADESDPRPKVRHKLRKTSSEGGNMNARARQHAMMAPSPAVPQYTQQYSQGVVGGGAMF
ncbi:hypothetical protein MMC20_002062 [Loxospora ochrophaea]|nr:hypothetical protein [Loxospora ochrophaea]